MVVFAHNLREDYVEEDDDEHQHKYFAMLDGDGPPALIIESLHLLVILKLEGVCDLAEEWLFLVSFILILCWFLDRSLDEYLQHSIALHILGYVYPKEEVFGPP